VMEVVLAPPITAEAEDGSGASEASAATHNATYAHRAPFTMLDSSVIDIRV